LLGSYARLGRYILIPGARRTFGDQMCIVLAADLIDRPRQPPARPDLRVLGGRGARQSSPSSFDECREVAIAVNQSTPSAARAFHGL